MDLWWFMSIVSKQFGGEMLYDIWIFHIRLQPLRWSWRSHLCSNSQNDVAVCFQDVTSIIFKFCIKFCHRIIVSVSNSQLFVNSSICKQHFKVYFSASTWRPVARHTFAQLESEIGACVVLAAPGEDVDPKTHVGTLTCKLPSGYLTYPAISYGGLFHRFL